MSDLVGFATWAEVLAWAREGKPLYYHAPLSYSAVRLWPGVPVRGAAFYSVRPRTIRITPPDAHGRGAQRTADPFTADADHLSRFRRPQ